MKKEQNKRFIVFCEPCSFKKILLPGQEHGLVEIKTSDIPGGIPQLDVTTQKTVLKPETPQKRKFKCPKCGRGVVAKELPTPYVKSINEVEEKKRKAQEEADKKKRLEDGKPVKRSAEETEFMG